MKEFKVPSRINNITSFIQKNELINIKPEEANKLELPKRVLDRVGVIKKIAYPQQGMCSLVLIIQSDKGEFILKVAKGIYRGEELYAEYIAMKFLLNSSILVPVTYDFFKEEDLYYLLRECSEGIALNTIFNESEDKNQRLYMIKEMAKAFCDIGDPYYNFAILKDYFRDNEEKQAFIDTYGIDNFDEERLNFYCRIVPFINI